MYLLVQIKIKMRSLLEFVPRDTEESEFLNLVDFGDVAFSEDTVIHSIVENVTCVCVSVCVRESCSVLQCVAVCCNVFWCVAICCNEFQCVALYTVSRHM